MNTYFKNCETVAEVKAEYKRLMFQVHPDLHDASEFDRWNAEAQKLNAAYHAALEAQHGTVYRGTDNEDHTYYYNRETEEAVAEKVQELIKARLSNHIDIFIIGTWVWVAGTRREDLEDRGKLKEAKLRWHSKRQKWYWHDGGYSTYNPNASFEDLKAIHGSRKVNREEQEEERAAIAA